MSHGVIMHHSHQAHLTKAFVVVVKSCFLRSASSCGWLISRYLFADGDAAVYLIGITSRSSAIHHPL